MASKGNIAVLGSGLIGRSFAMLYASAGYMVKIYDISEDMLKDAMSYIEQRFTALQANGLLKGKLTAEEQLKLITVATDMRDCVESAFYVHECVPERLDLKKKVFGELDKLVKSDTILASSTSCIPASQFSEGLNLKNRCIVVHPIYPPYYAPLIELIPAPWTDADVSTRVKDLMEEVGSKPIVFKKEILGFGINRIQYAIIKVCWDLVEDDVLEPEDVEKILKNGLGMRYAFTGQFETMHMNGFGVTDNVDRYGPSIWAVLNDMKPVTELKSDSDTAKKIHDAMCRTFSTVDGLPEKRKWRDDRLMALAKLKKEMGDD
ncbi:lambda-crystallin homolog [Lingula anatina]|uniref:Lambda-crystallin homolog n=1 Tax=Lingula anatina TaxID=7574 RepID=A0A1S3H536_LINAN|nr:lambda-crystallin homolog [Lingula anatina]|eukprot:XP_013381118.1 lambda-crystallin homolog [Lingula anatina]